MFWKFVTIAVTATVLFITSPASAVELKPCGKITSVPEKISCLDSNIVLLNSSYEAVAKELRAAVITLNERVDKIKSAPAPDLSNYVQFGSSRVRLHSQAWSTHCVDHDTGNADHIQARPCNETGAQDFVLDRRLAASRSGPQPAPGPSVARRPQQLRELPWGAVQHCHRNSKADIWRRSPKQNVPSGPAILTAAVLHRLPASLPV